MKEVTDEALARVVQKKSIDAAAAYAELVHRYEKKMRRYLARYLGEEDAKDDIVQEVFVRAYEYMQSFDETKRFSPWLYRVAHNIAVNHIRSQSYRSFVSFDFDTFLPPLSYDDPVAIEAQREKVLRDIRPELESALAELTPKYREVLELFYLEEMSYADIADVFHIPVGTVGVRVKRAKDALATIFKKRGIKNSATLLA